MIIKKILNNQTSLTNEMIMIMIIKITIMILINQINR